MYVIGDVHGCYDTLCALIEQFPNKYDEDICFVGDLIDRGPKSKDVVKLIRDKQYKSVIGNHELGFAYEVERIIKGMENNTFNYINTEWYRNWGGIKTFNSYGAINNINQKNDILNDLEFLKNLPLWLEFPNIIPNKTVVISHGYMGAVWSKKNLIKTINQKKRFEEYITWNRDLKHIDKTIFNIFGHTPTNEIKVEKYYVNIDTGVYNKEKEGMGKLSAIHIPSMKIYQQDLIDIIN